MKKIAMTLVVGLALSFGAGGCREEGAMEKAGRKMDEAMEDASKETSEAMKDAGEALDDAAGKMEEE